MRSGAGEKCLTILHFNDFHGKLEADEKAKGLKGGAARLATVLKKAEEESEKRGCDTYVLFGGDVYSGSLISSEFKGKAERRFLLCQTAYNGAAGDKRKDFIKLLFPFLRASYSSSSYKKSFW